MTQSDSTFATQSAAQQDGPRRSKRMKTTVSLVLCAVVIICAAVTVAVTQPWGTNGSIHPVKWVHYLGVYQPDAPNSYADVNQFAQGIGRQPNLVSYYSPWLEPFQTNFATTAAKHGAVTLIQMDPKNVSLAKIAAGHYDTYLRSYAAAVKAFGSKVVLSFGHEMNGNWYSWGHQNTSSKVFVAAWRHIVTIFREKGARNAAWLWTINIVDTQDNHIPVPTPWWPGKAYVSWIGIDGYYYSPTDSFAQVFGPTIVDVRAFSSAPILIAETGASVASGQAAKINDMFAGIRSYGLLGFVWFDADSTDTSTGAVQKWRIHSPAALAAFRQNWKAFMRSRAAATRQHPSSGSPSR
jgi:mannan endo-1,4-beta-mannosidase